MPGTTDAVKIKALRALLEDEGLFSQILEQASAAEKSADAMGLAFKDVDLNTLGADDLLEVALAMKEYEAVSEKAKKSPPPDDPEEDDAEPDDEMAEDDDEEYMVVGRKWAAKMDDSMTKMGGRLDELAALMKPKKAAAEDDGEATKKKEARTADLERTVGELQSQLVIAMKELQALKGELPRGLAGGRPTQSNDNIVREKAADAPGSGAYNGFLNFVTGGQ